MAFVAQAPAILGKAAHQAEFLRVQAGDPALAAFDAWLVESMEWALGRGGPHWPEVFARAPIQAFALNLPGHDANRLVAGALAPSADSARRQFPLVVAAPLRATEPLLAAPRLLPLVLEGFWAQASALLGAVVATGRSDLHALLAGATAAPSLSADEARALYTQWAAELPLVELWTLLGPPLEAPEPTLRLLAAALEPFRGKERPDTRLSLRLPLGRMGGVALCFWIDLVCRSLAWTRTIPSFLWSHDGHSGSAILHLGTPPRATLAELFLPSGRCEELCDLTLPVRPGSLATLPELPAAVTALLASGEGRVEEFLALLERR
jgi:type VI secretion system ImpM family protein